MKTKITFYLTDSYGNRNQGTKTGWIEKSILTFRPGSTNANVAVTAFQVSFQDNIYESAVAIVFPEDIISIHP
jgi:hypothetical protein